MDDWKRLDEVATDAYRKLETEHLEWLTDEEKAEFLGELKGYAAEKGWKPGWAFVKYRERFGHRPPELVPQRHCSDLTRLWIKASMEDSWKRVKATQKANGSW